MNDRRSAQRRRTFYRGTIVHPNRGVSSDCIVRDVSTGGARLELQGDILLPEMFELTVPQLDYTLRPVRVMWTRGRDVGVRFDHAMAVSAGADGDAALADRVARLESEVARLNRQFSELRLDIKRYRNEE